MVNFSGVAGRGGARGEKQQRESDHSTQLRTLRNEKNASKSDAALTLLRGNPGAFGGIPRGIVLAIVVRCISLIWVLPIGVIHSQSG